MAINRYRLVVNPQRQMQTMPGITISNRETDKYIMYNWNKMRFDTIAAELYGDDLYSWIIMLGNPGYFMEFDIPINTIIRVPFPLNDVLVEYEQKVIALKDK
jgi:hypothetical protein